MLPFQNEVLFLETNVNGKDVNVMRRNFSQGVNGKGNGRGLGRKGGPKAAGPEGKCICPQCGHKIAHKAGQPCNSQKCPKCSAQMMRE